MKVFTQEKLAERKQYYENAIINLLQKKYIETESLEVINELINDEKKKIKESSFYKIRESFLDYAINDFEDVVFAIRAENYKKNRSIATNGFLISVSTCKAWLYKALTVSDFVKLFLTIDPKEITQDFLEENKKDFCGSEIINEYIFIKNLLTEIIDKNNIKTPMRFNQYKKILLDEGILQDRDKELKLEIEQEERERKERRQQEEKQDDNLVTENLSLKYQQEKSITDKKEPPKKSNDSQCQRKLNNVLKLLYYIACEKYEHEEGREKETSQKFETLCTTHKTTIEKWLNDAADLVQDDE